MVRSPIASLTRTLGFPGSLGWVVAATFFHFASLHALFATLPLYVLDIGGSVFQVGLIVGVFAVASLAVRPLFGAWIDRAGRRRFLLLGAAIYVVASFGYLGIRSVPGLLVWRVFHAMGLATFTTAAASLAGDLAQPDRRGTTMAIYGLAQPAALSVGPAIGAAVLRTWDFTAMFLTTAVLALLALLCVLPLRDVRPPKEPGSRPRNRLRTSLVPPGVAGPAAMQFAASIAYGTIVSFIAVVARDRGLDVVGLAFTLLALSSLGTRLLAGRFYDRWGPRAVLVPGLLSLAAGMSLLAVATNSGLFLAAAALAGGGIGGTHTTLLARVVDNSPPEARGSAVAIFTSCWELGVGGGTIVMGRLAEAAGFTGMYLVAAGLCLCGLAGLRYLAPTPGSPPRDVVRIIEP